MQITKTAPRALAVSLYSFGNWFFLIIDFLKDRVLKVKTKIEHVIITFPSFSSKEASMTLLFLLSLDSVHNI